MGIRDFINSSTEAVKRNAPDLTTVKNTCLAACSTIDNIVGLENVQMLNRFLPGYAANIATVAACVATYVTRNAPYEGYTLVPDMDTEDMVWISICYPIKYEQSIEGVWKWKYTENDKGKTIPILVSETISYEELYDKVKEVLDVDTKLYKMEMSVFDPIMHEAPVAPIIIDCDNNVKWFVSVRRKTFLFITISNEVENHKEFGGDDVITN